MAVRHPFREFYFKILTAYLHKKLDMTKNDLVISEGQMKRKKSRTYNSTKSAMIK